MKCDADSGLSKNYIKIIEKRFNQLRTLKKLGGKNYIKIVEKSSK